MKQHNEGDTSLIHTTTSFSEWYSIGTLLWIMVNEKDFSLHTDESNFDSLREGSETDEINIKDALQPFDVCVRLWENKTLDELLGSLTSVKKEVHDNPEKFAGLVMLIMSHGVTKDHQDFVVTNDNKLLLTNHISDIFQNDKYF